VRREPLICRFAICDLRFADLRLPIQGCKMTEIISVRVRAFAGLREALEASDFAVELPAGADIAGLVAKLSADYPAARLPARRFTAAVNRAYAPPDRVLADGDEVALIPPVSGGSGDGGATSPRPLFEIVTAPISLDEVATRVAAADRGGITVFAGTVRGVTGQVATDHLEYEAYPEMAEAALAQIGAEALARWPTLSAVSIVHRVGRLAVGETSIAVAVAAAHRADTFDACHYAIDRVKQIAPIWKREVGPDGTSWVEGPEALT
jgi:molybdopterin synthase catalytic subunit